ncbi:hypothetical protein FCM35_KLT11795 [Carex littledalei]|uniref:Uncharacterized protein n=1 Tax=Carex littledalei TaxID=544730 RepID=A0A833VIP9_9POAL|nr:hypothetical protein FCM35_KLT11795 [Carex littledalei]
METKDKLAISAHPASDRAQVVDPLNFLQRHQVSKSNWPKEELGETRQDFSNTYQLESIYS